MTKNKNYYELLGIDQEAKTKEIKKAYRKMAEKYHPDKIMGIEGPKKKKMLRVMKDLNDAKDILLNPEKRTLYDSMLREQLAQGQNSFANINTITKLYRLSNLIQVMETRGFDAKKPEKKLSLAKKAMRNDDHMKAIQIIDEGIAWIEENYPETFYAQKKSEARTQRQIDKDLPSFDEYRSEPLPIEEPKEPKEPRFHPPPKKRDRPSECPKCFNPIQEDQDYCYYCGFSFD